MVLLLIFTTSSWAQEDKSFRFGITPKVGLVWAGDDLFGLIGGAQLWHGLPNDGLIAVDYLYYHQVQLFGSEERFHQLSFLVGKLYAHDKIDFYMQGGLGAVLGQGRASDQCSSGGWPLGFCSYGKKEVRSLALVVNAGIRFHNSPNIKSGIDLQANVNNHRSFLALMYAQEINISQIFKK